MISSEYQELSLLDLIMKVNGCDEKTALEKLRKEYLKIDDKVYTGYADLTYSIKDDEKGNDSIFLKYDLIALADYECTHYNYNYDDAWTSDVAWKKKDGGEVKYILLPRVLYRDKKFYIVDQITDKWDSYNPEKQDELDKFIKETGFSYDVIQRVKNNEFKFSDGLYGIDDTKLKEIVKTYIDNQKVIEKKTYGFFQYTGDGTFGFNSVKKGDTRKLAFKVETYSFTDNLGATSTIATNKDKGEYNKPQLVLTYDDIKDVVKDYADVEQLALLSNSDKNSFKAIKIEEDVDKINHSRRKRILIRARVQ